jgi:hypothetical protein
VNRKILNNTLTLQLKLFPKFEFYFRWKTPSQDYM